MTGREDGPAPPGGHEHIVPPGAHDHGSMPPGVHEHGGQLPGTAAVVVMVLAVAYAAAAARRRREAKGWSHWRTASFLAGASLLAAAFLPPIGPFAEHDLRGHMLQHLLLGMLAPLGLVLGAPVTLLLRSAGPPGRRAVAAVLRSRFLHVVSEPWVALALNAGGLLVLYLTPLYGAAMAHPLGHDLVHLHFVLAGYLFTWMIAGPDPAPRRPPVPRRLVVLGVAIAVHAGVSQLMYAGLLPEVAAPAVQLRGAAEIMYYGGDIAELLLAFAMITTWRPARRRTPAAWDVSRPRPAGPAGASR
ncbi:cytochrome c oxidase assembly protein [Sphaerisporangium fuscum]|uniref:cytochrome c oxidase assembly protein n=1 Tax=Sphaerisporangium fuscum TaxID=2835868 RepID=UPI0027E3408A|nr:cytochrome c oxidase assembly protein [Sphaerisporangium fuscum]